MQVEQFLKRLEANPTAGWPPDYGHTPVASFAFQAPRVRFDFWVNEKTQRLYIFWSGMFHGNPSGREPQMAMRGSIGQRPYKVHFSYPPAHFTANTLDIVALIVLGEFGEAQPHIRAIRQHCLKAKGAWMKDYPHA